MGNCGVDDYVLAIAEAVGMITTAAQGTKPYLIGHSLGGTIAAIYGAFLPDSIRGLVMLGAPLCFGRSKATFEMLLLLVPRNVSDSDTFPGSLLSYASALAFPGTFVWSRLTDAVISIADPLAMEIHARVERWALDEISLPGKLVHQIVDWLYRENRFFRGVLKINGKFVGPSTLSVANLALINTADDVAPPISVKPFADAIERKVRIIEYPSERGVCLQRRGILVGRYAQGHIWPKILSWLKSQK